MADRPFESWRARAAVSEALEVFNSTYMQEVWTKALARRESDPEGAVTAARTLLESLCKHILDDAGKTYRKGASLPELYKDASTVLDLAPSDDTAPIFSTLFTSCAEIVRSVGNLRNHLSDAHGRGPFGTMPDWRHAELAVNLSGAMATYLAAVWKGRQPTVADLIRQFLDGPQGPKEGSSQRYTLERLTRSSLADIVARKLQIGDLIAYCQERIGKGVAPQTLMQDMVFLRGALNNLVGDLFDDAMVALRRLKLVGKSEIRRRRTTHEEYDALIQHFRESDKHHSTIVPMADFMEFAVWCGRPVGEMCSLRWSDVDFDKHTCRLPGSPDSFPLLEKAWDIVRSRSQIDPGDAEERIFPYYKKSISARFTVTKNKLSETIPGMADLRLNDLRFEAVNRLLEKGHPPHTVARATGMDIGKVVEIFELLQKAELAH